MRKVIIFVGFFALASVAQAQVGPSTARVISRPMPSRAPTGVQTIRAEAKLTLTRKGRVYLVEILKGSGDDAFDKQWRKSLDDWRFVPAVTPEGEPTESTVLVVYTNNGITALPYSADGKPDEATRNVVNESERIDRLTCKDFLWEYELLTDSLSRRLVLLDPLLKTPQVMLAAESPLSDAQRTALLERYDGVVSDAARQCRDAPDTAFWQGVLKPAMQAALAGG